MEFGFVQTISQEVASRLSEVDRVSDYLEVRLSQRDYGSGIAKVIMGVSCIAYSDCPTGLVGQKKYTKSKGLLEVVFGLSYREVMHSDREQLAEILKRGVLATRDEVKAMGIKDFDVDAFYRDIGALIDERDWIRNPEKYKTPPVVEALWRCSPPGGQKGDQMDFLMVAFHTLGDNVKRDFLAQVALISNYLGIELFGRQYGADVVRVLMEVWYDTPLPLDIDWKRYYEWKRTLVWDIRLDYADVMSSDKEQFAEILKRGALATYGEVKALGIKDFDVDAFYRDLGTLFDERGWIKNPEKYQKTGGIPAGIPRKMMMPEADLWKLVQESIEAGDATVEKQTAYLEDNLAKRTEKEIVGFELTLRDLIRRSYHHNVVALLKAIEGMVTDDPLLYFRCRLILYGRDVFYSAVQDPNKLTQRLNNDPAAEHLLSVADRAFLRKFGENTDRDLPRDTGASYFDYDTDSGELLGRSWTDRTFAKRYADLLRLYQ